MWTKSKIGSYDLDLNRYGFYEKTNVRITKDIPYTNPSNGCSVVLKKGSEFYFDGGVREDEVGLLFSANVLYIDTKGKQKVAWECLGNRIHHTCPNTIISAIGTLLMHATNRDSTESRVIMPKRSAKAHYGKFGIEYIEEGKK